MTDGLALCAGYGGIELGLGLVLGDGYRTVGYVERDTVAAQILVSRMADQTLHEAPVWSDVTTFDGTGWRGCVDIVTAGFPCQPFSVAGKRRGIEDERWIWPDIARVIREVRPRLVLLENVPGLVRHGLGYVLGDLAEAGFDAEWDCFTAAEVGAPHKRERVFILAHAGDERCQEAKRGPAQIAYAVGDYVAHATGRGQRIDRGASRDTGHVDQFPRHLGDTDWPGLERYRRRERPGERDSGSPGLSLADAQGVRFLIGAEAVRDAELGRAVAYVGNASFFTSGQQDNENHALGVGWQAWTDSRGTGGRVFPPGPADRDGWREWLDEWPGSEPAIRRDADGSASRNDRLFACGNGVVPLAVAHAFLTLSARLGVVIQ